jgi:hypothetical protein
MRGLNKNDVIRMAREAGFDFNSLGATFTSGYLDQHLERFAALVAAAEREACAEVAEQIEREIFDAVGDPRVSEFKPKIAAAIRARGQG